MSVGHSFCWALGEKQRACIRILHLRERELGIYSPILREDFIPNFHVMTEAKKALRQKEGALLPGGSSGVLCMRMGRQVPRGCLWDTDSSEKGPLEMLRGICMRRGQYLPHRIQT